MFRNPRENAGVGPANASLPSTGRPPTPPPAGSNTHSDQRSPYFPINSSLPKKNTPMAKTQSHHGRQVGSKPSGGKTAGLRQNSILNFFNKFEDKNEAEKSAKALAPLFFRDGRRSPEQPNPPEKTPIVSHDAEETRFNEQEGPVKRRRTVDDNADLIVRTPSPEPRTPPTEPTERKDSTDQVTLETKPQKRRGGFLEDSSDEEDDTWSAVLNKSVDRTDDAGEVLNNDASASADIDLETGSGTAKCHLKPTDLANGGNIGYDRHERTEQNRHAVPGLNYEGTSLGAAEEFGDNDDFEDDEFFEGGEEYMERRWMEEQRELEMGLDEDSKSESGGESITTPRSYYEDPALIEAEDGDGPSLCPICNGSLKGLSESQASSHVNACLDGNAEPLAKEPALSKPIPKPIVSGIASPSHSNSVETYNGPTPKRFQRAAIARPAQSNPFMTGDGGAKGASAFTRLMSGHAEDAAWAEAAANEVQSRGKPAYQRTCPFYKIMPGMFICVDAFRYGKVEGQNAYFLSHFHSDHYIGLTSSWCHGPIYASKVTCNLMVQQLKVDPKWVVPLEFEKKVEVPNTKGVYVTMIPANHCPGSSLYLFEKVVGKNKDGSPRLTRILHCGDFRACPAHVTHPLLRPDVVDSITGQTKQQIIDTCYLDTTYLTPKYSFPSQHDVIDACAQMCVSLSKEIVDTSDGWEKTKAERAGSTMKKFLEQGEKENKNSPIKEEGEDREEVNNNNNNNNKPQKKRGRLLVVIGTYSIGKERICLGIARALDSKIYAPPSKMRICACLEDEELNARLTRDPLEAQVHMQTLMEIRAETLHEYMSSFKGHFARVVGFRPTGWSYRPPTSRFTENPAVSTVLHSDGWKTRYSMRDLAPQRGSTRESNCFGVPYSEHSSFRELTMFCCALRINRIVPTVNVGSARSREKMKAWIEKWDAEKRKNGLFKVEVGAEGWGSGDGQLRYGV
ncbi:DNA cross-link repair protein pso2/snm1 [Exophiala dermatitidis]